MAITRSQQAKQMLREGGRIGFRRGNPMDLGFDAQEAAASKSGSGVGSTYDSPAQDFSSPQESTYDAPTGAVDDKFGDQGRRDIFQPQTTNLTGYDTETGVNTPPIGGGGGDGGNNTGSGRDDGSLQTLYNQGVPDSELPGVLGAGLNLAKGIRNASLRRNIDYFRELKSRGRLEDYPQTVEGYKQYMRDRMSGMITASGNPGSATFSGRDDNQPIIPIQTGIMTQAPGDTDQETDEEEEDPFRLGLAFRADGGRVGAMDGGIMGGLADGQIDEMGRQMYFLGKLVKKATRAVKKIVKSPIGKAALLYAGGTFLGGLQRFGGAGLGSGTFLSNLKTGSGIGNLKSYLGGKLFTSATTAPGTNSTGLLSKILSPEGLIIGSSIAAGLTADQEQEAQLLADNTGIDIDAARRSILERAKGNIEGDVRMLSARADGGLMRLGYQEGSKEPVAKKTMPLLDMGGMEKDYREDGGFVPIGRMEKADDVPARLSKNEFVFTADAVRNAGEGDIDKGAEVMYNMMKNLEAGGEVSEESQGLKGARRMFQTSQRLEEVL